MKSFLIGFAALAGLVPTADAFWRLPCRGRTGLARIDPLMNPGDVSQHVHALHGASSLSPTSNSADLRAANCTSCEVAQDKSAYWTPALYFEFTNGSTQVVPQVGGMLAYYLLYGENITAFPDQFSMVAGDSRKRDFIVPIVEPPTHPNDIANKTEAIMSELAVGFNCLNYQRTGEASLYRHNLPTKAFIDANCADGLRTELMFPSCWNGKDAEDHRSHVAYPDRDGPGCPDGFPIRLPSLFFEVIWDNNFFKGYDGRFVLANGDPTGAGYHGDFLNGWEPGVLQQAVDICTNDSGQIQDCPVFKLLTQDDMNQCKLESLPALIQNENTSGPVAGLPGGVVIQDGPGSATVPASSKTATSSVSSSQSASGTASATTTDAVSTQSTPSSAGTTSTTDAATTQSASTSSPPSSTKRTLRKTPKKSSTAAPQYPPTTRYVTDKNGNVVTVSAIVTDTLVESDSPTASVVVAPMATEPAKSSSTEAKPLTTPAPVPGESTSSKVTYSTMTTTIGNVVNVVIIEEITVTITVTAGVNKEVKRRHVHYHLA